MSPKTPNLGHERQRNARNYAKTHTGAMISLEMASSYGKVFEGRFRVVVKERKAAPNSPNVQTALTRRAGLGTSDGLPFRCTALGNFLRQPMAQY